MFYNNELIKKYEKLLAYDYLIDELEKKYEDNSKVELLNSLIGYSWYFYVEGNVNVVPLQYTPEKYIRIWKNYIEIGLNHFSNDPYFNFIAGYTLSLHGFYLDVKYGCDYEKKGILLMEKCSQVASGLPIKQLADNFLDNERSKKYIPIKNSQEVCRRLFTQGSLLDDYFNEIYFGKK